MPMGGLQDGSRRIAAGLLIAGALLLPLSARAQSWPNDSGPTLDILRGSIQQWERLAPPPVDAERRMASLPMVEPQLETTVDVGVPVLAARPESLPDRQFRARRATRQTARRARRATTVRANRTSESRLERSVAERERQLERMQQQLDADRQRLQTIRGSGL